jgi:hypothetical protein
MSAQKMGFDGVWRPERDLNGRWVGVRYVDHGPALHDRYERQRDVQMIKGYEVANYFDQQDPCQERCDALNRGQRRKA